MSERNLIVEVADVQAGQPGDMEWAKRMSELHGGALAAVRATADRWTAVLTALLGVAGAVSLLQGPVAFEKLEPGTAAFAKGIAFGAAVLTLSALGCAIAAGQHASREYFLPTTGAVQEEFDVALEHTLGWLFRSRVLAATAIALALTSAALLWWGETEPRSPQKIELLDWPSKHQPR